MSDPTVADFHVGRFGTTQDDTRITYWFYQHYPTISQFDGPATAYFQIQGKRWIYQTYALVGTDTHALVSKLFNALREELTRVQATEIYWRRRPTLRQQDDGSWVATCRVVFIGKDKE